MVISTSHFADKKQKVSLVFKIFSLPIIYQPKAVKDTEIKACNKIFLKPSVKPLNWQMCCNVLRFGSIAALNPEPPLNILVRCI